MNDKDYIRIVPRDVLVKQGTSAIAFIAGGVILMLMTLGARIPLLGIILSVAALVIGVGALFSKNREDKKPGLVIFIAGVLGMVMRFGIPILKPFAGFILGLGAFGLFAVGIGKGIRFLIGLKNRG